MTRTQPSGKDPSAEPFCSNCGYILTGLTESSKCPECGKPLVEVLTRRNQFLNTGKRYRSKATLFGLPVIDIALGPKDGKMRGVARGIIAIGDIAFGGIALGGVCVGVVAVGGLGVGLCSIGGMAVGLLSAMGGMAIGGMAVGGAAFGVLATGGGAVGFVAQGGGAGGVHVRDGRTPWNAPTPAMFEQFSWFFGAWPPRGIEAMQPVMVVGGVTAILAAVIGVVAMVRWAGDPGPSQ